MIQLKFGTGKLRTFRTFKWRSNSSISEITRWETFWHVRTNLKEESMLKFLRLKYFWSQLSLQEIELCFDHPRFLNDVEFNVLLSLLNKTELDIKTITERSEKFLQLLGKTSNFRKILLPQWENNTFILAEKNSRTIRPHKAFSGWVRNASSVGSKSRSGFTIEPISEEITELKLDEFNFLFDAILHNKLRLPAGGSS